MNTRKHASAMDALFAALVTLAAITTWGVAFTLLGY